jgi:predicted Zn-dependent protease
VQQVIVHEMDHMFGLGHTETPYSTPNSEVCSDA